MSKYIIRLDDACEKRNIEKWDRIEILLDKYQIKPLVGIIPYCEDPMMDQYIRDDKFWDRVHTWINKGWKIALHGYNHVYKTEQGGINPVNRRSEFAGEPLEIQKDKIAKGVAIMRKHGIDPKVFFAPSHTFDENTITALQLESNIRIISDTAANKPYSNYGMTFVPQQSGAVRELHFDTVTFCYHPNSMTEESFIQLEDFLIKHKKCFVDFPLNQVDRKMSMFDKILRFAYFVRRK